MRGLAQDDIYQGSDVGDGDFAVAVDVAKEGLCHSQSAVHIVETIVRRLTSAYSYRISTLWAVFCSLSGNGRLGGQ